MMVGACAVGAPGVLIGPRQAEFGWDVADISAAFAVRLALFGLVGPFPAVLINAFGVRRLALVALVLIRTGVLLFVAITGLWQLFLSLGLVSGYWVGPTAWVPVGTVLTGVSVYTPVPPLGLTPH